MSKRFVQSVAAFAAAACLVAAFGSFRALAMINPNFTPVSLVNQSPLILELSVGPIKDGKMTASVKRVIKGKFEPKTLAFNVKPAEASFPAHVETLKKLITSEDGTQAIFFGGGSGNEQVGDAAAPAADAAAGQKGFLHVGGTWVAVASGAAPEWNVEKIADTMLPTWNGGTDMLIRAADYVIADPEGADIPVKEGASWSSFINFAQIEGPVSSAMPVDLAGDGKLSLFIAGEAGDHLYSHDAAENSLKDVTATAKLASKSKVATWIDANADGRMDLLSYDGDALTLYTQAADGTFGAGEKHLKGSLPDGVLALTVIDCGKAGHPGAIISTKASPLLWRSDEPDKTQPIGGAFASGALGAARLCVIADFDGDAIPDVIQLFEKGSLVYKGKSAGAFEDAKPCAVATGGGIASAFLGDFDADGQLDIFTVSTDASSRLWDNRGKFQFVETMSYTGELSYKGGSGAIGGAAGDFNNDGRQDLAFFYASGSPHHYFNRGFRSFGLANELDIGAKSMIPDADAGQQAGCMADFNRDGAQDTVIVQKDGKAWIFWTDAGDIARCARGVLSSKGAYVGPLTVTGWKGERCLGAWNVTTGTSEAFVGMPDAGEVLLKWQFPGQKPQEKKVVVEKSVRVVIEPAK